MPDHLLNDVIAATLGVHPSSDNPCMSLTFPQPSDIDMLLMYVMGSLNSDKADHSGRAFVVTWTTCEDNAEEDTTDHYAALRFEESVSQAFSDALALYTQKRDDDKTRSAHLCYVLDSTDYF